MVFTPYEVLVYDGEVEPTKILVWKGWRDKETGLWRIPLTNNVTNINTQTKLLNRHEMIQAFQERTLSVYNLPSKTDVMMYLHAALGFPTKEILLAATQAGFLTSWPELTALQTAKNHLKARIEGCDNSFPMHLWDRRLPQAELTCNLLRPANANPNISVHQYVHGNHDYITNTLHPLGCKVQAFNDTKTRRSWEENSKDGYYIGTSMNHHRT
ncbi:hypothetical protein ACHAW6_006707 [Cyclotella cf. meneghiniana]